MGQIQMLGLLELDVLSSIEIPFLSENNNETSSSTPPQEVVEDNFPSQAEADKFDMDIFALRPESKVVGMPRDSIPSLTSNCSTGMTYRLPDKRPLQRNSTTGKIDPIEESPKRVFVTLPAENSSSKSKSGTFAFSGVSKSPSQSSILSLRSNLSASSSKTRTSQIVAPKATLASKLAPSWLFNPFRSQPSEAQTSPISASASSTYTPAQEKEKDKSTPKPPSGSVHSSPIRMPLSQPLAAQVSPSRSPLVISPMPVAIRKSVASTRPSTGRTFEDDMLLPQRIAFPRRSPVGTPPRDEAIFVKRRSATSIHSPPFGGPGTSSSPGVIVNPSQPHSSILRSQSSLAKRWQHMFPQVLTKYEIKWAPITVPMCLPLTVEYLPTNAELESLYDVFSYDFVVDPGEMKSFLVKPPMAKGNLEEWRRAWALVVMRGMAAVRLAQGFQFVVRCPFKGGGMEERMALRRAKSLMAQDNTPKCIGASDVLHSPDDPVYLSMTNEIHHISYTGEAIQVRRYVRRRLTPKPFEYQCLMWPKLGGVHFPDSIFGFLK